MGTKHVSVTLSPFGKLISNISWLLADGKTYEQHMQQCSPSRQKVLQLALWIKSGVWVMQANRIDSDWEGVKGDLQRIRDTLLQRRGALVNLTADDHTLSTLRPHLDDFLSSLPAQSAQPTSWGQMLQPCNEAITVPTQVGLMQLHVLEWCCKSCAAAMWLCFQSSLLIDLW